MLLVTSSAMIANGKKWEMCELAREMYANGFPRRQLNDWMCLVKHESNYDQKAINPHNTDGSTDWGLFQVNDRYWCKNSELKVETSNL